MSDTADATSQRVEQLLADYRRYDQYVDLVCIFETLFVDSETRLPDATVLAEMTGSAYFPGGIHGEVIEELEFDDGAYTPVELQWATYFDASDEAGRSRLYGGIHIAADDFEGRRIGSRVGDLAVQRAWALIGIEGQGG